MPSTDAAGPWPRPKVTTSRPVFAARALLVHLALVLLVAGVSPASGSPVAQAGAPRLTVAASSTPYEIRSSDYSLGNVELPDLPRAAPLLGHVVAPVDAPGARPLVLLLHGKHSSCYDPDTGDMLMVWPCQPGQRPVPSYLGYDYLQRSLARQGYVTVSIAANAVDGQEDVHSLDSGMTARSALVRQHLRGWAQWAAGAGEQGTRWGGRVDMDKVVLVGHSRGGEGVDRAAIDTRADASWAIVGQMLLAPTAILRQEAPGVPTVVLLPYCDGDLNEWPGQAYVDIARDVAPDPSLRSAVTLMGANHNFFNTEWTPGRSTAPSGDDAGFYGKEHPLCGPQAPGRLDDGAQRSVTRELVGAAADLFTGGDPSGLRLFDGRVDEVHGAPVSVSGLGGLRVMVRPGVDAGVDGTHGANVRLCTGRSDGDAPELCGRDVFWVRSPHWPSVLQSPPLPALPANPAAKMSWSASGARLRLSPDQPIDLSGSSHLDARIVVDPERGPVRLAYRIVDGAGRTTVLEPRAAGRLEPMPGPLRLLGRLWGQTLRARLDPGAGTDLTDVHRIDLVARSRTGRVWLLDASGWRRGLAPATGQRVPRVNVGDVTADEGAGGERTLEVPVRVDGDLATRGRVAVQVLDLNAGPPPISVLALRPGQHRATVSVPYQADRRPDGDVEIVVNTWALSGVVTGDRQGRVVILDDDS